MARGSLRMLATLVVSGALLLGAATQASAASGSAVSVPGALVAAQAAAADQAQVQQIADELAAGRTAQLQGADGSAVTLQLQNGSLNVDAPSVATPPLHHADACWKAYAVASALLALGAVALATIIAAGLAVGATEITIVGITLTPGAWGAILGAMGSWSALLALVAHYTC
jgi:hypothetical protein